jgi:hypothetical protein
MVVISTDVTLILTTFFNIWHIKSPLLTGPDLLGKDLYHLHMFDFDTLSRLQGSNRPLADFDSFVVRYMTSHPLTHGP